MHLKKIKLVGFKSFVDLTSISFANEMTAIVGPNGCGKSNIIDAVRWVLGESSAKNLRGDSMTDVIFNGANSRKPVGQASVELVFDNSESRVQGTMADRSEISIKRVVNRDAQNRYFLNGSKCRRKDITDIFLGTGLGPRSYAIIEQGMISKLIESKPQELRVFIEEAAGVSKYKERRRETEIRIKHTRENLQRLVDIKQELNERLEKLHAQSVAASRFTNLKKQERHCKAQLIVFRWQQCQEKAQLLERQQNQLTVDIERVNKDQTQLQVNLLSLRQGQETHNAQLSQLQQQQLQLTRDITRLEQNIGHARQNRTNIESSLQETLASKEGLRTHIQQQQHSAQQMLQSIEKIEPELHQQTEQLDALNTSLQDILRRQRGWQTQWDTFLQQQGQYEKDQSVNESKLHASHSKVDELSKQLDNLVGQMEHIQTTSQASQQQQLTGQVVSLMQKQQQVRLDKQSIDEKITHLRTKLADVQAKLHSQTQHQQQTQAEIHANSSLLNQHSDEQAVQLRFLQSLGYSTEQTLLTQLKVNKPWHLAIEMVIGEWLKAHAVNDWPADFEPEIGRLFISESDRSVAPKPGTLATELEGDHPFVALLNQIQLAETPEQAKTQSKHLDAAQSIICPQGYWYGRNWFRKGIASNTENLLERQAKTEQLRALLETHKQECEALQNNSHGLESTLEALKGKQQSFTDQLNELASSEQQLTQQIALLNQEISLKEGQQQQLQSNQLQVQQALTEEMQRYDALLQEKAKLKQTPLMDSKDKESLKQQREQMNEAQDALQHKITDQNKMVQQLSVQKEQLKVKQENIAHNLNRDQDRLLELDGRFERLNQQKITLQNPMQEDEQQLNELSRQSLLINNQITEQQQCLADTHEQQKQFEQTSQKLQHSHAQKSQSLNKKQLTIESLQVRSQTLREQLLETHLQLNEVLKALPEDISESQWQIKLERFSKEISQLGAINLAAIDEYETEQQRFSYLQQQSHDLETALATLESAIKKIDNESRDKFKLTFDKVNNDLKSLFPKVFGGGTAYLDLTSDDFLETGVTIMARPPGKKNSTIHLLSGGEKALTALSLVFAIFRLNPAPFCMLDEVDAPLDDANVGRFCNLVKEMSQSVQFIYISHNKIAMEMASHLTGVTMFEPGVSRMVSVDIDDAIAMAEEF